MKTHFSDFLFLSLLPLLPFLSLQTEASASSRDVENLMSFKNALLNSTTLNDWVPIPGNPCSFTGVTCHRHTRRVSSIDLSSFALSSDFRTVAAFLLSLDTLETLSLKSANISGPISFPPRSNCSPSLTTLDLSQNLISGPVSDLASLGVCPSLKSLNLSSNSFDFSEASTGLKKLSLKSLDLSFNKIAGSDAVPFLLAGGCSELEFLSLKGNGVSGDIAAVSSCSSLKVLDLSANSFTGGLPDSISKLASLETLDLSANKFTGRIPIGLCQHPTNSLKQLLLQDNMLTGSVPASLSNCSQLTSLHLSFNYLTGSIPPSLGPLANLRDLKLWFNRLTGEIPPEITKIKALETLILDFNELTGVIPASISNCTRLNWISLSNNRLTGEIPASIGQLPTLAILKLSNNSISGRVPPELGDCKSLIWLDLNSNLLNGTIPPELFRQSGSIKVNFITGKKFAYLKNMKSGECHGEGNLLEYAGIRQGQLGRIATRHPCRFTQVYKGLTQPTFNDNGSMIFLDLSYNMLSGSIPKEIGTMSYLYVLNLGHNRISGAIPQELGNLEGLNILNLAYNDLQGVIPNSMTRLTLLTEIDMSNNRLTGTIPDTGQFETFQASSFADNAGLCGIPLPLCGQTPTSADSQHRKSSRRQMSLVGSVAMGLLLSLFCIFAYVVVFVEMKKRRAKKDSVLDLYIESRSNSGWKITGTREQLSVHLTAFEKPLQKLTFGDLLEATNGFHNDCLIGSGGFGDVYRAELKDRSVVAVKKLIHISGQGDREFTAEMETIGKVKHQNLVPLLGYCKVGEERLLVYEYMKYGSLEDVLHNPKKSGVTLNWPARRKIAIGAARGLAFLHHNCFPHIIHRDMKSSNVLLDENLEARVSDFGMARLMNAADTHLSVSTLAGTPGYVPPEYYQSFRCTTKGDVYSYGVVLLELLTGKRPTDSDDFGDNNLVGWVKQHAKLKKTDVFDPVLLKEDPGLKTELSRHLEVACACLDERPLRRPTMIQVMARFKEIQVGSGLESQATMATEDGGFQMVEMTVKEDPAKQ